MKKAFMLMLLVALLTMTTVAMAAEVNPGDTITMAIAITSSDETGAARISINTNGAPVTFVSAAANSTNGNTVVPPKSLSGRFSIVNVDGKIQIGSVGTVTLKVAENAAPGTYTVSPVGSMAAKGVSGSVTFTVKGNTTCDHANTEWKETKKATCTTPGEKVQVCKDCGTTVKTEPIPATGHTPSTEATRVEPTCTKPGSISYVCTVCGEKVSGEEIPPIDHAWDKGVVTVEATCTENGMKTYTCTACGEKKTEPIPATGHTPSNEATRIEPTCTKPGSISYACTVCGEEVSGEVIPATGHSWDAGVATTKPTCETDGVKTITCTACGEKKTEVISKLGHAWDKGNVTTQPTCTTDGVKTYTCANGGCTKTEVIPAKGHTAGEWVETKPATNSEEGEQKRYCTVCGEVLETQTIARKHPGYNMTVCSVGPRFRDVSNITTEWDMFTPVDISEDGVQRYDLIAGNMHVIGEVILTVADGSLTVTYEIPNGNIRQEKDEDFLSILPSLSSVESLDRNSMTAYKFGEPISIADDLGGDTKVLLYVHNRCNYSADTKVERFFGKGEEYTSLVEAMSALMD